jgi:hypothetical protein
VTVTAVPDSLPANELGVAPPPLTFIFQAEAIAVPPLLLITCLITVNVAVAAGAWYVARYESFDPPLGFRTQMLDAVVVVMGLSLGDPVDQFLKVHPVGVVAFVGAVNFTNGFPLRTLEPPVCTVSPAPSLFTAIVSVEPAPAVQVKFVKPWNVRVNETPEPVGPEAILSDASVKEVEAVPKTLVAVTL